MFAMFFHWMCWIAVGFALAYAFFHWQNYHRLKEIVFKKARKNGIFKCKEEALWIRIYRSLSWRKESRIIGKIAKTKVPSAFRNFLFGAYVRFYGVDMTDVAETDLAKYTSLNEFFSRILKDGSRPISNACLDSPADCHIYHFGKVNDYLIEEVKGIDYHLTAFLGVDILEQVSKRLENDDNSSLWYCVCYLSPADYHRFHSPADWTVLFRRHFSGRLLSVSERIVSIVPDLFDINERVLITGEWEHGFFSLTAVGATHVGAIELDFDDHPTNCANENIGCHDDRLYNPVIKKQKGNSFGRFLFGSTLVLVFQAPLSFAFTIAKGDKLEYGQAIGRLI